MSRGACDDTWLVVEHEPVVTLGRNANAANVLLGRDELAARGIEVVEVERGGDATFHGPGQIVVYPIVRLERFREVVPLVSALERAVVTAVASFGIVARPRPEHRGVYVGDDAIAAIGLSVRAMTSFHGVALNVTTDLAYATLIVPCGTPQFGVTSIARASGRAIDLGAGRDALLRALEREFDVTFAPSLERVAC